MLQTHTKYDVMGGVPQETGTHQGTLCVLQHERKGADGESCRPFSFSTPPQEGTEEYRAWYLGLQHIPEDKVEIPKPIKLSYSFKLPRELVSLFDWQEYPALFLYLRARELSKRRGGYFNIKVLGRSYSSRTTFKRHLDSALSRCLIIHIRGDIYRIISLYKLGGKRRRGHYGLPGDALYSLKRFKAAIMACEQDFQIENQRNQYDKIQKLSPQKREALVKLRSFKRRQELAKVEKKGRPLATRLLYDDLNAELGDGTFSFPKQMRRLLYQFLPEDKPNVGYVDVQSLADYFGVSINTASKYRWLGKSFKYTNVELSAIELEPQEHLRPYVLKNRVFRKDGKLFYRMTSRITSFVYSDQKRSKVKRDKSPYIPLYSMI